MAMRLERLPLSRHLTPRPGHRNNVHSFHRGDPGAAHTPFLHAAPAGAASVSVPAHGAVAPRLLSGLVAIPCDAADVARVHEAAAVGGAAAGMALPPTSATPAATGTATCPFRLPLGSGSPERQHGGAGPGAMVEGPGPLSPVLHQADVELLQAIFAGGEEGEEGMNVKMET